MTKVACINKNSELKGMAFNSYTGIKTFYKSLKGGTAQCAGCFAALVGEWSRFSGIAAQSLDCVQRLAAVETAPVRMIIEAIVKHQSQLLEIMTQAFDRYYTIARALSDINSSVDAINVAINGATRSHRLVNKRGPAGVQSDAMQAYLDSNRQLVGMCARFDARRYVQWADLFQAVKHAQLIFSTTAINAWSSEATGASTEITPEIATAQVNLFSALELPYNMKVDAILYQEACHEIGLMQQPHDTVAALTTQPPYSLSTVFQSQNAVSPGDQQSRTAYNQTIKTHNPTSVPQSVSHHQHSQTMVQGPYT